MASIAISASMQRACTARPTCSLGAKEKTSLVTVDVESKKKKVNLKEMHVPTMRMEEEAVHSKEEDDESVVMFSDEKWKNGTWDLNMFVKHGKMDWDSVITAEARRRKILEIYPETATNETPVTFRSSIIPWWAWAKRSYLPEAELLNGRAAMVGFFAGYLVDVLTGLDVVGQTGNTICKAALLVTVIGVILVRKSKDIGNWQKLVGEATYYDKQWQTTWQDQDKKKTTK
ncbi:hypothetical protein ACHQM5_007367 [Ranunculus cassubicifolius]